MPPLVTVVVPSLNRADYIEATLDGILAQDYPHVETIVVDGGSTDGSIEILESYGDEITWISEPDDGHADAINKGWRMGEGDILAWLNADDVYASERAVSTAVSHLVHNPEIDLVYGDYGHIDGEGNVTKERVRVRDWNLEQVLRTCDWTICQPTAFARRSVIEQVGYLDTSFAQKKDHELWLRIGLAGRIDHVPEVLAHDREIPGLTQQGDEVARSCVQLTRKILDHEELPSRLHDEAFKREALSNAYLMGALYAYPSEQGGHRGLAARYISQALRLHPSNAPRIFYRLAGSLLSRSTKKRLHSMLPSRLVEGAHTRLDGRGTP